MPADNPQDIENIDGIHTNRLADEPSPYLKQHAHNPVDWFPWGSEAFEKAIQEDKPIFLSIGYSTCHWCHVMAHESFEDPAVAAYLNEHFVSIKVDREERPDVDHVYMAVCQAMTKSGGWPLTIVMTPAREPFFAGTYFPRESRGGRIGILELLGRIRNVWENARETVYQSTNEIIQHLENRLQIPAGPALMDSTAHTAAQDMAEQFDTQYGGFREAPKFPSPHNLIFLLQQTQVTGDVSYQAMAVKTLTEMRLGGIYDQVGGGFHRYSTDRKWHLPHFEKMLYDQALLIMAYTDAYQITRNGLFKRTVEETIHYLVRDMRSPGGAYFSAEDADSEGEEGKFYTWSYEDLERIVGQTRMELLADEFSLSVAGNYLEEATRQRTGLNILHMAAVPEKLAERSGITIDNWWERWENDRLLLLTQREKRIRPGRDEKLLVDWNGLTIAALAKAARVLGNSEYATRAREAADFILENMRTSDGTLQHRYAAKGHAIPGFLDDYANLIWGLRELYETVFDARYLQAAVELQQTQDQLFWDAGGGGYFFTPANGERLISRSKEIYDGAYPSGNAVAAANLFYLARITGNTEWESMLEKLGKAFSEHVRQVPAGFTALLMAITASRVSFREIVVTGPPDHPTTQEMLRMVQRRYEPFKVLLYRDPEDGLLTRLAPFTKEQVPVNGRPTAYVCENYTCRKPVDTIEALRELLGSE
ncbi:MAG: thioredoxin domain-containing protein [Candidatus Marinimicrobia bacterium]|nr:thioredoxin domain-containing protein [Candidatus Neomarinimicrobiota bacterium]MCF7839934.1 thioredoxin domain-containing protein [Candidatus Neomarinimicrobiota bacterium]